MYCDNGVQLLKELKRTDQIPPFNYEQFRNVTNEILYHYGSVCEVLKKYDKEARQEAEVKAGMIVHHLSGLRGKRVALAYLNERKNRIRNIRWQVGPSLSLDQKQNLSPQEIHFFNEYHKLLSNFNNTNHPSLDLTSGMGGPPKGLFVEVRVLEDVGQIVTDSGNVLELEKNTTHFMRRSEAEPFLKKGLLELV